MKKLIVLLAALAILFPVVAMATNYEHIEIDVWRETGFIKPTGGSGQDQITTGCTYWVFSPGTKAGASIYEDSAASSEKTNPVTTTVFDTDGQIDFWIDTDNYTTFDILIVDTAGGYTNFVNACTSDVVDVRINEVPLIMHAGIMWYSVSCDTTNINELGADGADNALPYDTGVDFAAGTMIMPQVYVSIACPTYVSDTTLSVGLGSMNDALGGCMPIDRTTDAYLKFPTLWSDISVMNAGAFVGSYGGRAFINRYDCLETGAIGGALIANSPCMILTDTSLNYSLSSGEEGNVHGERLQAYGHGFIHYFFVPGMI